MDDDGLVPVVAAGVLGRIRIDGQLMNLSEQHRIFKLLREHFREHLPTLRRGVKAAVIMRLLPLGHAQPAAGTNGFKQTHGDEMVLLTKGEPPAFIAHGIERTMHSRNPVIVLPTSGWWN